MESKPCEKQTVAILSVVSLLASVAAAALFAMVFRNPQLMTVWRIVTVVSLILPIVAKKIRIEQDKKGKTLEIIALILAGFAFYEVVFVSTKLNIWIGYLGFVIGGIAYRMIK